MNHMEKKRKKKQRSGKIFSFLVLCFLAFGVFQFESIVGRAGRWIGADAKKISSIDRGHSVGYKDSSHFLVLKDFIVKWGNGILQCYDSSGQALWKKPLNGKHVKIQSNKLGLAVAEPQSGDVFLLNHKGELKAKRFGLGFLKRMVYTDENRLSCYFPDKKKILILDDQLKTIADIPVPDGELVDINVSQKSDLIALSLFRLEEDAYHSQIFTYHKDGQPIGAINMKGQLLLDICVIENTIIGITDTSVFAYNDQNEQLWEKKIDRAIKKADISEKTGFIILNLIRSQEDIADNRPINILLKLDRTGKEIKSIPISYDIDQMKLVGNRTIFSAGEKLYILSEKGKLESILKLKTPMETFSIVGKTNLGIEFADRLEVIELEK